MPGQAFRRQNVRKKLSAVSCVLEGRSVLLVDDSIVRGTTSREIVRIVKEAGARKVYFCSASPPVSRLLFVTNSPARLPAACLLVKCGQPFSNAALSPMRFRTDMLPYTFLEQGRISRATLVMCVLKILGIYMVVFSSRLLI